MGVTLMGKNVKLGIVVSEFNYDVTKIMLEKAVSHAHFLDADPVIIYKVPGTYDSPFAVKKILDKGGIDAVVVLGAVIKGETDHDQVVANQAARKIIDLSLEYGVPVSLGIIGPNASRDEAIERAEEYAARAVETAVKMARRSKLFESSSGENIVIE